MIRRKTNKFESRKLMLERRIAKLEAMLDLDNTQYVYQIYSTMTDDNFYFISDDELLLKSLINSISDLFFKSMDHDNYTDAECDTMFNKLMRLCESNGIKYQDDMDEPVDFDENIVVIKRTNAGF